MRIEKCVEVEPALLPLQGSGPAHRAACHRSDEIEQPKMTSTDVFPVQPQPPAADAASPREQRATVLDVRDLVKEYPAD